MADHKQVILSADAQQLKLATDALLKAFGGQVAAEASFGVRQQKFSDWKNPHIDRFMPVDVVAQLEACTHGLPGHPHITRLLARRAGYQLVPLMQAEVGSTDLLRGLAKVTVETGDLSRAIMDALDDGHVCAADLSAMEREAEHLESAVAVVREKLRRLRANERGGA